MITFSKAQTKYSDTVKNVLGVNIFPILSLINESSVDNFCLYFSYKHFFSKGSGALRLGVFSGSKDDGRYNDEYIIIQNDSMQTFHSISGYSNYAGLKIGYERRKLIRPKLYFSFGADLIGAYNHIDMYDDQNTVLKMTDTFLIKSEQSNRFTEGSHSFIKIGFSPFIAYDYILSKKLSLTIQVNYDWTSEYSIDAGNTSNEIIGNPSFNLMLNYNFSKRK